MRDRGLQTPAAILGPDTLRVSVRGPGCSLAQGWSAGQLLAVSTKPCVLEKSAEVEKWAPQAVTAAVAMNTAG